MIVESEGRWGGSR